MELAVVASLKQETASGNSLGNVTRCGVSETGETAGSLGNVIRRGGVSATGDGPRWVSLSNVTRRGGVSSTGDGRVGLG
jgi:hypothetical protein